MESGVATAQGSEEIDRVPEAPTAPYDEMYAADVSVRPHFAALARRLQALGPGELDERQVFARVLFVSGGGGSLLGAWITVSPLAPVLYECMT